MAVTDSGAGAPHKSGWLKWLVLGGLLLAIAGILAWFGTQPLVEAARPADNAFLKANKASPGVVETASGLQYQVLSPGAGANPGPTDFVQVHYVGTLVDGTEFDSSVARGQPVAFRLDQVIPGWSEGVQLMKPGATYRFVIPPALGYGARGAGGVIPPNAVLKFDVQLLAVKGG